MDTVAFTRMEDGTAEDYALLDRLGEMRVQLEAEPACERGRRGEHVGEINLRRGRQRRETQ